MSAKCLQNIISIRNYSNPALTPKSLSGLDIYDLPGFALNKAAQAADAEYLSGQKLIEDKLKLALIDIKSELVTYLQANNYIVNSIESIFRTGEIRRGELSKIIAAGDGSKDRGIIVKATRPGCTLRKMYIPTVYIKSNFDGPVTMKIVDGVTTTELDIELDAGLINAIDVDYTANEHEVEITLPNNIPVYSVDPNCGCNGKVKSDCASTLGFYDETTNKTEGYGIIADVQCNCDYDFLLCQLAKNTHFGKIVLYLTGSMIMDEISKSERLNYWTIYGQSDANSTRQEWLGIYGDAWNSLIASLRNIIPSMDRCGCLDCGGVQIKANV